jgi:hypothetical protein
MATVVNTNTENLYSRGIEVLGVNDDPSASSGSQPNLTFNGGDANDDFSFILLNGGTASSNYSDLVMNGGTA